MGQPKTYIEISNFGPGIFADLHGETGATATRKATNLTSIGLDADGAAVVDGTFGCIADGTGALVPLPAPTAVTQSAWDVFPLDSDADLADNQFYVLDARIVSYVVDDDHDALSEADMLFVLFGAFVDPDGGTAYAQVVWGCLMGLDFDYYKCIYYNRYAPSVTPSPTSAIMSGNVAPLRQVEGARDADGFVRYDIYAVQNSVFFMVSPARDGSVGDDNTNWATGTIPADEQAITSYAADTSQTVYPESVDGLFSGVIGIFPDPLDLNSFFPRFIGGLNALPGFFATAHQGRAVMASLLSRGFGSGLNVVLDRVTFSPVYNAALGTAIVDPDITQFPIDYTSSIAGDENTSPIGTMGTIQASELFVVKHGRGGVLMRGDMDNFEAVALPYVESTYGIVSHGVGTPLGFVYGSRTGVYVWNGGQVSESLSPQLVGFFWQHQDDIPYVGNQGRFAYWQPYLCVPNSFIYDTNAKSWWKLEDTENVRPYNVYDVSALNGKLYAIRWGVDAGDKLDVDVYDPDVLRSSWSWRSQPIISTLERQYTIETVEITATTAFPWTADASVTVTLTGFDLNGNLIATRPMIFTLNDAGEYGTSIQEAQVPSTDDDTQGTFTARYVQVLVAATATGVPAPKLHKLRLGVTERTRPPIQPVTTS